MEIIFSRHARRRMQLYEIKEQDVVDTISAHIKNAASFTEKGEIIDQSLSDRYGFPLKIVFSRENDTITVITAYPLRKGLET